jgi:NitT/TauT family transport system ATP-binding protein
MLKLEHLSKSFDALPVLQDLSLEVRRGEILALTGPSGCGKSTLLNIIAGLEQPDSGSVVCGAERIGYMFQGSRLLPWRTVFQNIRLVREDAPKEEILSLIEAVGLKGFENYYPGQLSGGMARRCALARAFHYGGELLLMDEPFQGLDYGLRMEMLSMLLSVWKKNRQSVLFVTHEIDEALTVASRIAVLSSRPTIVLETVDLPGAEGRDASAAELTDIRQHIIHRITQPSR